MANRSVLKTIKLMLAAVLLGLCAGSVSFAQHGGKAEPNRIEFNRGDQQHHN